MARKRKRSLFFRFILLPGFLFVAVIFAFNLWIVLSTSGRVYDSVEAIPSNAVGIVLGTSKNVGPDRPNLHFENRLAAAAELYHAGKVKHLLVSGHRDSQYYDEPRDMTRKLESLGVPLSAITADESGLRTLDSIVRANKVFGLTEATIVSDDFHVGRALFIADWSGLDAIALSSKPVGVGSSFPARAREYLARVKAILDLYVLGTEPARMDDPVEIPISEETAGDST